MAIVVILITLAIMTGLLLLAGARGLRHPAASTRWASGVALGGGAFLLSSVLMVAILPAPVLLLMGLDLVGQVGSLLVLPSLYFHLRLRQMLPVPRWLVRSTVVLGLSCLLTWDTLYDRSYLEFLARQQPANWLQSIPTSQDAAPIQPVGWVHQSLSAIYLVGFIGLAMREAMRIWPWRNWWRARIAWLLATLLLCNSLMVEWLGESNSILLWLEMSLMLWVTWEMGDYVLRMNSPTTFRTPIQPTTSSKYDRSPLTPAAAEALALRLQAYLAASGSYRQPGLSLDELADALEVSPHALSQAMNQHLQLNFYELVNQYRVQDACRQLADPARREQSLLAIAFEAGFQSKSTFNSAFKKLVGETPSLYRERMLTEAQATKPA